MKQRGIEFDHDQSNKKQGYIKKISIERHFDDLKNLFNSIYNLGAGECIPCTSYSLPCFRDSFWKGALNIQMNKPNTLKNTHVRFR